jgi:hypothetical protein
MLSFGHSLEMNSIAGCLSGSKELKRIVAWLAEVLRASWSFCMPELPKNIDCRLFYLEGPTA